jgi:hypothetical protein
MGCAGGVIAVGMVRDFIKASKAGSCMRLTIAAVRVACLARVCSETLQACCHTKKSHTYASN